MMMSTPPEPGSATVRGKHAGTRTCIGCGARVAKERVRSELVRLVLVCGDDGRWRAVVDLRGSTLGRGAWVHARPACLRRAAERGLSRAVKARVEASADELAGAISEAAHRRVASLLGVARRSGRAAIGSRAAQGCGARAALWIVARDAGAAARRPALRRALERGRVITWADKGALGRALQSDRPVAVVAIADANIAEALLHAAALAEVSSDLESIEGIH
jgi:predicted RNA-binding protein YlxR (DUF448 family)